MKFLFAVLFTTFSLLHTTAQTRLAVRGGFNYSTARAYFSNKKQSVDFVPGANFGIQLKTAFDGPLHFSPYISYSNRGYIINSASNNGDKTKNSIHYVDVAPILSLDFKVSGENTFVIGVGPTAGLAISGTEKTIVNGVTTSSKMDFSTSKNYGLFDFGLHTSLGYHFRKMFVEVAWQHGLTSINNNEELDNRNIRNRTLSINLGYYFRSFK